MTAITYMNEDLGENEQKGELRLYLKDKIVDVMPRMGRTIVFKSCILEHEVKPTLGYDRYAITTWLHTTPIELVKPVNAMPDDGSIFVGIPSYRDSLIIDTIKSLMENA